MNAYKARLNCHNARREPRQKWQKHLTGFIANTHQYIAQGDIEYARVWRGWCGYEVVHLDSESDLQAGTSEG